MSVAETLKIWSVIFILSHKIILDYLQCKKICIIAFNTTSHNTDSLYDSTQQYFCANLVTMPRIFVMRIKCPFAFKNSHVSQ